VASCVGPGFVRSVSRPEAFCVDMLRLLRAPFEDVIPAVSVGVLDVNFQLQVFRVGVSAPVEVAVIFGILCPSAVSLDPLLSRQILSRFVSARAN
jgi:hypothetical protein